MIELKHISKTFNPGTPAAVVALRDVNLNINKSEFVVMIGSNGSGKSTLLNAVAGSVAIDEGEIKIDNQKVNNLKEHRRSRWIARIFQNPMQGTAPDLSILDNFRLAAIRTKRKTFKMGIDKDFREEVKSKISLLNLGLENKIDQSMGTLSGGQRQALTLIMAVMDEAQILLMDEPTAALDPRTAELLMQKAQQLIKDFTLTAILITHNLKDAHQYGNRLVLMGEGKIVKDVAAEQKNRLSLIDLFSWFE